jgi:hypothetical protein
VDLFSIMSFSWKVRRSQLNKHSTDITNRKATMQTHPGLKFTSTYNLPGSEARARRAEHARKTRTLKTDGRGHPTTSEMDYSKAEEQFMMAVDAWKTRTGRRFPTLSEILGIARALGYEQSIEAIDLEQTQEIDTLAVTTALENERTAPPWSRAARSVVSA